MIDVQQENPNEIGSFMPIRTINNLNTDIAVNAGAGSALLHNSLFLTHLANLFQSYYVNWRNYNESLVKRGEILLNFDVIDNWNSELEKMNKDKEGRKFVYPDSFIKLLGHMRAYFH